MCYELGFGVEKNYEEAFKWYSLAAKNGSLAGQYQLGWCYFEGFGVNMDVNRAKEIWIEAADEGYEDAILALKEFFDIEDYN